MIYLGYVELSPSESRRICKDNENVPLRAGEHDTVRNELREERKERWNNRSHGVNEGG